MKYYNTHTHIFSAQYVPNNVVGIPVMNFLARYPVSKRLVKFFSRMRYGAINSRFERISKFAAIGLGTSQETIFNHLEDYYKGWGDVKFVILPMDMEQMGAGRPLGNYLTQLDEIVRLRAKGHYAQTLLPFLFVDPRRPQFTDGDVLLAWVKRWFDDYGFVGIKMYPALGYYPFDEKLDALYSWCEAAQIPITYHCSQGVIHYRGNLDGLKPPRYTHQYHRFDEKEHKRYQANFTDPENFAYLLEKYKRLKICLAHFGGEEEITKTGERKGRWYEGIKQLMRSYENVFTDISFSLHNTDTFTVIAEDLNTPVIGERILFGTDYFVVEKDKDESYLRDELKNYLRMNVTHQGKTVNAFDQMAAVNPVKYLTSAYYTA